MGSKRSNGYERSDIKMKVLELEAPQKKYIKEMDAYINELRKMNKEKGKKYARKSLIQSGVLDEKGKPKKNIVNSWE